MYLRSTKCTPNKVLIYRHLYMLTVYVKSVRFNYVYFVVTKYWTSNNFQLLAVSSWRS
jgi:hypothetical protein